MESKIRFCSKCGAKLKEDAAFCGACGAKVRKVEEEKKHEKTTWENIEREKVDLPIDKESIMNTVKRIPKGDGLSTGKKRIIGGVILALILLFGVKALIPENSVEKQLVGTWIYEDNDKVELVFYKDGTYRHGNDAVQVNGDYKVLSDTEIELTSNQSGLGQDMWHVAGVRKFDLDGDTLILDGGGATGTYHRSK